MNFFNSGVWLKNNGYANKNKLKDLLSELRGFNLGQHWL